MNNSDDFFVSEDEYFAMANHRSLDDELMDEFKRIDEILTECLNHYRSVAQAFYLTTDEIAEFKESVYSGKVFGLESGLRTASVEEKKTLLDHLQNCCEFDSSSVRAYNLVEPFMQKACVRMGLAKEGELSESPALMCDSEYDYAFEECLLYSGTILRFMTEREISDLVGYVDKGAVSNILMRKKYYLSDIRRAFELHDEKEYHSMPVWCGRVPYGKELKVWKRVSAYENAKKRLLSMAETNSDSSM